MCSCEFYKMFHNTFFIERIRVTASVNGLSVQDVINYLFFFCLNMAILILFHNVAAVIKEKCFKSMS